MQRVYEVENSRHGKLPQQGLQLGWPKVGRRLVGREGQEDPQSQLRVGMTKALCAWILCEGGQRGRAGGRAFGFGEGNWLEARPQREKRESWETGGRVTGRAPQLSWGLWGLFNIAPTLVRASPTALGWCDSALIQPDMKLTKVRLKLYHVYESWRSGYHHSFPFRRSGWGLRVCISGNSQVMLVLLARELQPRSNGLQGIRTWSSLCSDGHRTHRSLQGSRVLIKMVSIHHVQWVKQLQPHGTELGLS